jgi:hypothetical protein
MAWCPGAAPLAPSAAPGCPMEAAGTGTILGTASTPTHWQAGQAATTTPRLVTAPVALAAAAVHVEPALRIHPLILLDLPQLSSATPMAERCATIRTSLKHTKTRPAAKA